MVVNQAYNDTVSNIYKYFSSTNDIKSDAKELSHHLKLHKDYWGMTLWKKGAVNFDRNNVIDQNEKLLLEVLEDRINMTNKSPIPEKFIVKNNVILLQGIRESIDRDIGAVSTELDYSSIGTSATAEAESQTDLQAEFGDAAYARLQFSVSGSRSRVNQTMKLGMLWDDSSFDSTPVTIREAGAHWHVSDASKCHARVVSTDFVLDAGDLFVVQINELQENGTL